MGVQVDVKKEGYTIYATNIPQRLRDLLTDKNEIQVSFKSPTPVGYKYLGRNHAFTEHLSNHIINNALHGVKNSAARAAVLRSSVIKQKTVLFQLRVRNVIAEQPNNKQIVAEEMWLWGYEGELNQKQFISKETAIKLLMDTKATQNMEQSEQAYWLNEEMVWVKDEITFRKQTDAVALERANHLVESHTHFKKLVSGSNYKVVEPVLPMDVLGVYILLPEVK
jgi:ATP-dependent Lon protease